MTIMNEGRDGGSMHGEEKDRRINEREGKIGDEQLNERETRGT